MTVASILGPGGTIARQLQNYEARPQQLAMAEAVRCASWISLKGREAARGRKTVRITIPRENVFSPASLQAIFERLRAGGDP